MSSAVEHIITRRPIPPGQITLYKALYEAQDSWMSTRELADAIRWSDNVSLRGVLGALGLRANQTEGTGGLLGLDVLIETQESDGELRYRMRPELRKAIDRLPPLRAAINLSVESIYACYQHEADWLVIID